MSEKVNVTRTAIPGTPVDTMALPTVICVRLSAKPLGRNKVRPRTPSTPRITRRQGMSQDKKFQLQRADSVNVLTNNGMMAVVFGIHQSDAKEPETRAPPPDGPTVGPPARQASPFAPIKYNDRFSQSQATLLTLARILKAVAPMQCHSLVGWDGTGLKLTVGMDPSGISVGTLPGKVSQHQRTRRDEDVRLSVQFYSCTFGERCERRDKAVMGIKSVRILVWERGPRINDIGRNLSAMREEHDSLIRVKVTGSLTERLPSHWLCGPPFALSQCDVMWDKSPTSRAKKPTESR
ncbi:hypothetical protein BGZ61DRAFT_559750 [Ilyonectria robusta]|uniref:uncharacterized protein n=1 Tax=Ilyonectria robusta TaxID=1079257 RepID=UPI001E8DAD27|nr:uncharacterized protein BGZ61DRAFT_559750 [Ilyonectria robusta]KAH8734208.1 hypothetical protein BGZ61DRAFT_559750 [Ilyonectria robusta]